MRCESALLSFTMTATFSAVWAKAFGPDAAHAVTPMVTMAAIRATAFLRFSIFTSRTSSIAVRPPRADGDARSRDPSQPDPAPPSASRHQSLLQRPDALSLPHGVVGAP